MALGADIGEFVVRRLADKKTNLAALQRQAAKDGLPSVIARQDQDVLLLSGPLHTRSEIARTQSVVAPWMPDHTDINVGDSVTIAGKPAEVLAIDDGFNEIPQKGLIAAVIEEGPVDATHPALKGRVLPQVTLAKEGEGLPPDEHATHVAGIIAGQSSPDGAHGIAQGASILPINIRSANDTEFVANLAKGIRYAADQGAQVINVSLGLTRDALKAVPRDTRKQVQDAVRYAESKDSLVVTAAGNHNDGTADSVSFPGRLPRAVTVANYVDTGGQMRYTSGTGPSVDIAAPGTNIVSSVPGGYAPDTGTSMSAPYVSGASLLIKARHPKWTPTQIKRQLFGTATDYGTPGKDTASGNGVLNLFSAVFGAPPPKH